MPEAAAPVLPPLLFHCVLDKSNKTFSFTEGKEQCIMKTQDFIQKMTNKMPLQNVAAWACPLRSNPRSEAQVYGVYPKKYCDRSVKTRFSHVGEFQNQRAYFGLYSNKWYNQKLLLVKVS